MEKKIIVKRASHSTTKTSQQSTHGRAKKLPVKRPLTPFVPPRPTIRLGATKNAVGPTTRRTIPIKRITQKNKI